jgi:hypothetical protein
VKGDVRRFAPTAIATGATLSLGQLEVMHLEACSSNLGNRPDRVPLLGGPATEVKDH